MPKATCLIFTIIFSFQFSSPARALFRKVEGIEKSSMLKVKVHNLDSKIIYASSKNVLFKSDDAAETWSKIFIAKDELKDFYLDPFLYNTVYIASSGFVYRLTEKGAEKIFTIPPEIEARCIYKHKAAIYLGTSLGVYFTDEDFLHWKRLKGLPEGLCVNSIEFTPLSRYIAAEQGVYVSWDGKKFKRTFVVKSQESEEEDELKRTPQTLSVDIFNNKTLYLGTSKGLYVSYDQGKLWEKVLIPLVERASIFNIQQTALEKSTVYLATDSGIYLINIGKRKHQSLFEGLTTKRVRSLSFDVKGKLFAATDRGIFKKEQFSSSCFSLPEDQLFSAEPGIAEIQEVCLKYNEVDPEKLKRWRRALKFRALLPSINLDYDRTINYDSGSDRYYVGPSDWGVKLSWDLADLVWNSYHDDVDTRSRLSTQLRISILEDINSLYFERLRVKRELLSSSFNNEEEKLKKELRLKELTAALDGYTGGYFSKRVRALERGD